MDSITTATQWDTQDRDYIAHFTDEETEAQSCWNDLLHIQGKAVTSTQLFWLPIQCSLELTSNLIPLEMSGVATNRNSPSRE